LGGLAAIGGARGGPEFKGWNPRVGFPGDPAHQVKKKGGPRGGGGSSGARMGMGGSPGFAFCGGGENAPTRGAGGPP